MTVQLPVQPKKASPELRSFLAALVSSGISERSRDAHRRAVGRFAEFMVPQPVERATAADLKAFLAYLGELGVSEESRRVYRTVLLKWLEHLSALAPQRAPSVDDDTGILRQDPGPPSIVRAPARAVRAAGEAAKPPVPAAAQATKNLNSAWADDGVAARPEAPKWGVEQPSVEPVPMATTWPAPEAKAAGPAVPAATTPAAPTAPFGFGAESADVGEATMLLPLGPTLEAGAGGAGAAGAVEAPRQAPTYLRAPVPPAARTEAQDAFDPGFAPTASPGASRDGQYATISVSSPPASDSSGDALGDTTIGVPRVARPPREPRMGQDKLEGWSVRLEGGERREVSLAEIRNMVLAGTISPETFVCRPGGEWMRAGDFAPLSSVFASVAQAADGEPLAMRGRSGRVRTAAMTTALAWAGALAGAAVASMGWWLGALLAGRELSLLAALGGLFAGFAAPWLARSEGRRVALAGACAAALSVLAGRYLVFASLQTRIVSLAGAEPPESFLAFFAQGLSPAFAISVAASVVLGFLLGHQGAGRPR